MQIDTSVIVGLGSLAVAGLSTMGWMLGRLHGKVDWKIYNEDKREMNKNLFHIREDIATLLERSKSKA